MPIYWTQRIFVINRKIEQFHDDDLREELGLPAEAIIQVIEVSHPLEFRVLEDLLLLARTHTMFGSDILYAVGITSVSSLAEAYHRMFLLRERKYPRLVV